MGNDPQHAGQQKERGQRVFCSDRGQRSGCGRTFSLYYADVLPRHTMTAALLTGLLGRLLLGGSLKAAAEALPGFFALDTFYRLGRKLRRRLDIIRTYLCREQKAPESAQIDPLRQTIEHMRVVLANRGCLVAAFQQRFQLPFLG